MLTANRRSPRRGIFTIMFAPRSGSTYLILLLNQHENIICYPEVLARKTADQQRVFLEGMVRGEKVERLDGLDTIWPSCQPVGPKASLFRRANSMLRAPDWVGLKTKPGHISDQAQFRSLAEDNQFRLIHLSRRNPVATAVSVFNARRLKETYRRHNLRQSHYKLGALHIDKQEFDRILHRREAEKARMQAYVDRFNTPVHHCYYEDLLADRGQFLQGIFDFLETPMQQVDYHDVTFKNTATDLSEAIENFEELRDAYKATEYEAYFAS